MTTVAKASGATDHSVDRAVIAPTVHRTVAGVPWLDPTDMRVKRLRVVA